jgi:tetratricopeptide (TPR) repeat protein
MIVLRRRWARKRTGRSGSRSLPGYRHAVGVAVAAAVGTYAAVVASLPDAAGWIQFGWAALASLIAGVLGFLQAARSTHGQPAPARPANLFQLPRDIDDFTGRTEVLHALVRLASSLPSELARPVSLAVISGKGGVGKTTLAVHLAHRLGSQFPDGQLYVNLRGAESQAIHPARVLAGLLRELGMDGALIPEALEERARNYRARLFHRRTLVVLDNAATDSQVRPLLPGSPTCFVVVTSRSRLPGLESASRFTIDVLEPEQAVTLLARIVGQPRVTAEYETAQRIARLCGYLPLAVRIAGARLAMKEHWRLETLAARLMDERQRLAELEVGDLEVRTSFALSYGSLSDEQQTAFRLLGLIDAPDFCAWVAGVLLDIPRSRAEEIVEFLVDAQLLEVLGDDPTGTTRYRFHDLLRLFARDCLAEEPVESSDAAVERLVATYMVLVERADAMHRPAAVADAPPDAGRSIAGVPLDDPIAWFTAERPSLVALVEQAHRASLWTPTWRLANGLAGFFMTQSHWSDWARTHELGLDASRRSGDVRGQAAMLQQLGRLHVAQARWREAVACLEPARSLFQTLGDPLGEADTLRYLAEAHGAHSRFDESIEYLQQCIRRYRAIGHHPGEAESLLFLGNVYRHKSRYREALASLEGSLFLFRQFDNEPKSAEALRWLATVYWDLGLLQEAIECIDDCLLVFRRIRDRWSEALALANLGDVYRDLGRYDKAIASLNRSLDLYREMGYRLGEVFTLHSLGDVQRHLRRYDEALLCLKRSLDLFGERNDQFGVAYTLHSLADVYRDQGQYDDAVTTLRRALDIYHGLDARLWEGRALISIGLVHAARGDRVEAESAWRTASRLLQDLGVPEAGHVDRWLEELSYGRDRVRSLRAFRSPTSSPFSR